MNEPTGRKAPRFPCSAHYSSESALEQVPCHLALFSPPSWGSREPHLGPNQGCAAETAGRLIDPHQAIGRVESRRRSTLDRRAGTKPSRATFMPHPIGAMRSHRVLQALEGEALSRRFRVRAGSGVAPRLLCIHRRSRTGRARPEARVRGARSNRPHPPRGVPGDAAACPRDARRQGGAGISAAKASTFSCQPSSSGPSMPVT